MSDAQLNAARSLLPGLHYLAIEALRSGCPDISQTIYQAISQIETIMNQEGEQHEQRGAAQDAHSGTYLPH